MFCSIFSNSTLPPLANIKKHFFVRKEVLKRSLLCKKIRNRKGKLFDFFIAPFMNYKQKLKHLLTSNVRLAFGCETQERGGNGLNIKSQKNNKSNIHSNLSYTSTFLQWK